MEVEKSTAEKLKDRMDRLKKLHLVSSLWNIQGKRIAESCVDFRFIYFDLIHVSICFLY